MTQKFYSLQILIKLIHVPNYDSCAIIISVIYKKNDIFSQLLPEYEWFYFFYTVRKMLLLLIYYAD